MPNFLLKPTPILIVGIVVVLAGLYFLYDAIRNDPTGIGAGIIGLALVVMVVLIGLDRLAVTYLPFRPLVIAEVVLVVLGAGLLLFPTRTSVIDCSANKADYLVIIQTKDQPAAPAFAYQFPFSRVATVAQGNIIEINQTRFAESTVTTPSHWNGTFSRGIELSHPRYVSAYFYGAEGFLDNQAAVDSLLKQAVGGH
jgi:hypothetical protein